jgi:hypothetical protein
MGAMPPDAPAGISWSSGPKPWDRPWDDGLGWLYAYPGAGALAWDGAAGAWEARTMNVLWIVGVADEAGARIGV